MKALCIREPWASMILSGEKTIETRTWQTHYRGPVLLCASKKPVSKISGCAFAVAELVDCRRMSMADEKAACCDLYYNAWSWVLSKVKPVKPFGVKGMLGLFEVNL